MISFSETIIGKNVFFRGPTSRKPYKVKIVGVDSVFLPAIDRSVRYAELAKGVDPKQVADANLKVEFTNGKEDVVSIRFLFHSWDQAVGDRPIRPPAVIRVR